MISILAASEDSLYIDIFSLTKLHRDIAMRLLECVEDEEFTDQATVKVLIS